MIRKIKLDYIILAFKIWSLHVPYARGKLLIGFSFATVLLLIKESSKFANFIFRISLDFHKYEKFKVFYWTFPSQLTELSSVFVLIL